MPCLIFLLMHLAHHLLREWWPWLCNRTLHGRSVFLPEVKQSEWSLQYCQHYKCVCHDPCCSLLVYLCVLVASLGTTIGGIMEKDLVLFVKLRGITLAWLMLAALNDIIIAVSLVWSLVSVVLIGLSVLIWFCYRQKAGQASQPRIPSSHASHVVRFGLFKAGLGRDNWKCLRVGSDCSNGSPYYSVCAGSRYSIRILFSA